MFATSSMENDSSERHLKTKAAFGRRHRRQTGMTMSEVMVSAVLLVTVMTFVTTICFQLNFVWKDIRHHGVAVGELSNQLESLTRLSLQQAQLAVDSLEPSVICERTLTAPELSGKLVTGTLGTRVELAINWKRRHPGKPVRLTGWISPPANPAKSDSETEQ